MQKIIQSITLKFVLRLSPKRPDKVNKVNFKEEKSFLINFF